MRRWLGAAAGVSLLLGGLSAASCVLRQSAGQGFALEKSYGEPATGRLTVRVSRLDMTTADDLTLILEVRAADGSTVSLPEVGDTLGPFTISERWPENRTLDPPGGLTVSRRYTLEPFLPGSYSVPSLSASILPRGEENPFLVTSEEIPVQVSSVLPLQLGEQDLEGLPGPRGIPSSRPLWFGLGGAALAGAAAAALLWSKRARMAARFFRRLLPWDAALEELDRLLAAGLITRGEHARFYQEISGLTRRYIERRFSVRAPEQTTEEFLRAAALNGALTAHAPLLANFLGLCDLVKFARHTPAADEVAKSVEACRQFITATAGAGAG